MPVVIVLGAKGGCGASLVATNLALALGRNGQALLVDLHIGDCGDDLLLDLRPERSWADLLRVATELTSRHVELALCTHPSGLRFLAGPAKLASGEPLQAISSMVQTLAPQLLWMVIDPSPSLAVPLLEGADLVVLVTTADPPALRAAQRRLGSLLADARRRVGLVLNQFTRAHPAPPASVAASLECPLLAVLPTDPRAAGFQVSFGRPCVLDRESSFGRGVAGMARTLAAKAGAGRAAA